MKHNIFIKLLVLVLIPCIASTSVSISGIRVSSIEKMPFTSSTTLETRNLLFSQEAIVQPATGVLRQLLGHSKVLVNHLVTPLYALGGFGAMVILTHPSTPPLHRSVVFAALMT